MAASAAAPTTAAFAATPTLAAATLRTAIAFATGRTTLALGHALRLRQQGLPGEAHLSALVALQELHLHAIALLDDVFGSLCATVLHLGDVQQSFRARHDLDEGAEGRRGLDGAFVDLADHGLRCKRQDHLSCALHGFAADGRD